MTAFIAEERILLCHMNCTVNSEGVSGWSGWCVLVSGVMNCCSDLLIALVKSTSLINVYILKKDLKNTRNLTNHNSDLIQLKNPAF